MVYRQCAHRSDYYRKSMYAELSECSSVMQPRFAVGVCRTHGIGRLGLNSRKHRIRGAIVRLFIWPLRHHPLNAIATVMVPKEVTIGGGASGNCGTSYDGDR